MTCSRNGVKREGESCTLNNKCTFPQCVRIDLKAILYKQGVIVSPVSGLITYLEGNALEAMKEVWNLAVDKCIKAARIDFADELGGEGTKYHTIMGIEQVKQMIKL